METVSANGYREVEHRIAFEPLGHGNIMEQRVNQ